METSLVKKGDILSTPINKVLNLIAKETKGDNLEILYPPCYNTNFKRINNLNIQNIISFCRLFTLKHPLFLDPNVLVQVRL